jgi:hypothetical protein
VEEVSDDREEKARAIAMAAMFFACLATGSLLAYLLTYFQGGYYIPLLMPYLLGRGLGTLSVNVGQRWTSLSWRTATLGASGGALATVLGYHYLAYGAVLTLFTETAGSDVTQWLLHVTGEEGFQAYAILATDPELPYSSHISPFGIAGSFITDTTVFSLGIALEVLTCLLGAAYGVKTTLHPRREYLVSTGEPRLLAQVSMLAIDPILEAMDAGNFVSAGKLIADSDPDPEYRITILFPVNEAYAHILQVTAQSSGVVKAHYKLSIDQALMMMDQIRLAEARHLYNTEA